MVFGENKYEKKKMKDDNTTAPDKIYADYSSDVSKSLGILFSILIISIAVLATGLGLTLSAYKRDNDLEMAIGGGGGFSFADSCWSCIERTGSPGTYDLIVNARMESQVQLFAANGFSFANQYDDTGFGGNRYIVDDTAVLKTIPARFNFDQNLNEDRFGAVPAEDGIVDQKNPSRRYCDFISPTLNDDEISIFLGLNSAVPNTQGYYPVVNNGTIDFPCGNYLGSNEFFFCASTSVSPSLGCTIGPPNSGLTDCRQTFQTSQVIYDFPAHTIKP